MRFVVRQATVHERFRSSGLMTSVKVSGTAAGAENSISAPVLDRLRMTHSMTPPDVGIEPPLNVRCLVALRLSSMPMMYHSRGFQMSKVRTNSEVNYN